MSWSEVLYGAVGVIVFFGATRGGPAELYSLGGDLLRKRWTRSALWIGRLLAAVPVPGYQVRGWLLLIDSYRARGSAGRAAKVATKFLEYLSTTFEECQWHWLNSVIDALVSAGRYREAVAAQARWSARGRRSGRDSDPVSYAFTQINRAEAFFELGESAEALSLLEHARPLAEPDAVARNGLLCLEAWISIHEGELERARDRLARVDVAALSPVYAAEVHYTWAAYEREAKDLEHALQHAERGLQSSVRPSSERNGLFMIASIEALRGNHARAKEHFERAVGHHYRGQGADGLFRYAEFLERTEGAHAAEPVYGLLIERDGESALATHARRRISKLAA